MRILIDNGSYHLQNLGDVAMLQVAVRRLWELWPHAQLQVVTTAPERLCRFCPGTCPVDPAGRKLWLQHFNVLGGLSKLAPSRAYPALVQLESEIRLRWPRWSRRWVRARLARRGINTHPMEHFLDTVPRADLVLASGGGYITDVWKDEALPILETLRLAKHAGIPCALMGQGLGPLDDASFQRTVREALRCVDFISLREKRRGPALLQRLGFALPQAVTTGDDAVEMAYAQRPGSLGNEFGINIRMAEYSSVDQSLSGEIRDVLSQLQVELATKFVPVPISVYPLHDDREAIKALLPYENQQERAGDLELDSPADVIRQVGRCRMVITGSYHAGVFALSQGVPIVGLAKSPYYMDKFYGLAEQFGVGCEVVLMDAHWKNRLPCTIRRIWATAESLRPELLNAAAQQVEAGRAAYRRLCELVSPDREVTA